MGGGNKAQQLAAMQKRLQSMGGGGQDMGGLMKMLGGMGGGGGMGGMDMGGSGSSCKISVGDPW